MSRTSDPPNDPMARLDTQRCDTRVIDVHAMRAIHAAFVTGVDKASADGGRHAAGLGGDAAEAPDTILDGAPPIEWHAARAATPPAKERARGPMEREGLARPELVAEAPQLSTVEVDYSPAVRLRRARSAKVQRTARIATAACIVLASGIGLWAAVRAGSSSTPPASSVPAAQSSAPVAKMPDATAAPSTLNDGTPHSTAPSATVSGSGFPASEASPPATEPVAHPAPSATARATGTLKAGRPSPTGPRTAAPSPRPSGPHPPPPASPLDAPIPE